MRNWLFCLDLRHLHSILGSRRWDIHICRLSSVEHAFEKLGNASGAWISLLPVKNLFLDRCYLQLLGDLFSCL
ncbi:MAG: hypothetical protein C0507_14565 [Cyanobacteria bacterium PR.3.49]|nr:hypothetical protein [Cyanobacteria bacterium PR.3.49]